MKLCEKTNMTRPITVDSAPFIMGPPANSSASRTRFRRSSDCDVRYAWQRCALKSTENPTDKMSSIFVTELMFNPQNGRNPNTPKRIDTRDTVTKATIRGWGINRNETTNMAAIAMPTVCNVLLTTMAYCSKKTKSGEYIKHGISEDCSSSLILKRNWPWTSLVLKFSEKT